MKFKGAGNFPQDTSSPEHAYLARFDAGECPGYSLFTKVSKY